MKILQTYYFSLSTTYIYAIEFRIFPNFEKLYEKKGSNYYQIYYFLNNKKITIKFYAKKINKIIKLVYQQYNNLNNKKIFIYFSYV